VAASEKIFDGAEHEREGRAEFVADVAEEGGLGAVDFGEAFEAFAFGGCRFGALNRGRKLVGDEIEEGAIFGIEAAGGIYTGDENAESTIVAAVNDGKNDGLHDGLIGETDGDRFEIEVGEGDDLGQAGVDGFAHAPESAVGRRVIERDLRRANLLELMGDAVLLLEKGEFSGGIQEVEKGEGQVVGIFSEGGEGRGTCGGNGFFQKSACGEFGEGAHAPGVDDFGGSFGAGAEQAGNFAGLVEDRTVRKGVVGFFHEVAAAHEQADVVDERAFPFFENLLRKRADDIPNFGPDNAGGLAECGGMFGEAEYGDVGVVIEKCG